MSNDPRYGTVKEACAMVGGEKKPISAATYYRGVKAGRFTPPEHPSPNISRVDLDKLAAKLRARNDGDAR
jgi:hypothetical protein